MCLVHYRSNQPLIGKVPLKVPTQRPSTAIISLMYTDRQGKTAEQNGRAKRQSKTAEQNGRAKRQSKTAKQNGRTAEQNGRAKSYR